jgi:serine/threonine-protein kinase
LPQKIGKYEVIEELGRGAMGVVYKARDPFIGRLVALKTITTGLQDQPELLQRFYREAQAAGGLAHPNIVTIFDLGEGQDGTPYIAMEFLEGVDLEHIITESQPMPLSQKLGYMVQVARALDYAHKRGVVHRDIKPANIVVTKDGTIKVVDFGIARLVDTSRSQTGLLIGTVNYMSPEQVRGERVDGRSDIFSVGVMCYEFFSGQRPFNGNNFTAVMLAIISQPHKPLKEVMTGCPDDLSDALDKILRKDVAERYQTLEEFLLDIDAPWKRLQKDQVAEMVAQGEQYIANKDFAKARDVLRQAIQIDTAHKHAKTLFEKVNAELKRMTVLPEAQQHVQKAEALLREGKISEASAEAEAAIKLDSVYQPAQDIRVKIQEEANKQQLVKDFLRTTRQRLAEGDLTAADQTLKKLLEADKESKEGQELRRQLEEEKARRSKRQKLLDSMQQARNLWTQQNHEESLKILNGLLKEFPGEAEVTKLLETVQEDQAEQEKHAKLSEAKSLLNSQRFADALGVLEPLVQKYKGDAAVTKLYDHIQAERKIHAQRVRMEKELAAAKKLVNEEKFAEALAKAEPLAQEFPDEPEFARLVEYARGQQAAADRQSRIKAAIQKAEELLAAGKFAEAAEAADKGLDSFPGNMDLKALLDDARAKQKEKEKKEYLERQIAAIKAQIDSGDDTAAIDLARKTLAVVKHSTDVTSLMHLAEQHRQAKRSPDEQLKTIVGLAMDRRFDEADKALKNAEKTSILNPQDPRWQELMSAVKEKRAPVEKVVTAGTVVAPAGMFRQVVEEPEVAAPVQASGTMVQPPATVVPPPAPPKVEPPKKGKPAVEEPPRKEERRKAKPGVEEPRKIEEERRARPAVEAPPPKKEEPKKEEKPFSATMVQVPVPKIEEPKPTPKPAPKPVEAPRVEPPRPVPVLAEEAPRKSPVMMIGIAAVVVIGIAIGVWMMMGKGGGTAGLTTEQQAILQEADKLFGERKLSDALAKYKQLPANAGGTKLSEIEKIVADEKAAYDAGQNFMRARNYSAAMESFKKAADLNGDLKAQAEAALKTAQSLAAGADPKKIEADTYQRAASAMKRKDWAGAVAALQEVIGMDGANKARAQADLQTAQARVAEETAYNEGMSMLNSGNRDGARQKFQQVLQMNGLLRAVADRQIQIIDGALNEEKARAELIKTAETYIGSGQFRDARALFPQIQQMKGDTAPLETRINQAEQQQFASLRGRFEAARTSKNENALKDLQSEARQMAQGGGSQASNAQQLADREIADALKEIETEKVNEANRRAAEAAAKEKEAYDNAVSAHDAAVSKKDVNALRGPVTRAFQQIVSSGSRYAAQANDYLSNKIPEAIKLVAVRPCPNFFVTGGGAAGITQNYKAGDLVPAGLLEAKPAWTTCQPYPEISATAYLSVTIDESGNVIEVKQRQASPSYEAAAAAVKNWKVSPAPKFKGLGVKTTTALDLKP